MNIAQTIMYLYPNAIPMQDFSVYDDGNGQYIKEWNLIQTQPTEAELEINWLNVVKQQKIDELNKLCEQTILAGFIAISGHKYGFSQYDQMNITQQMALLLVDTTITTINWKTEDAGVISHTRDEFVVLCNDANNHKRNNITKYWTLKAQVNAATTEADIGAISW